MGEEVERVFQCFEILGADQDGDRPAVARENDAFVLALNPVDDLGEMRLDLGERQRLGHDRYCSHRRAAPGRTSHYSEPQWGRGLIAAE